MKFKFSCVATDRAAGEWIADELERVSKMLREGFSAGDVNFVDESGDICFHGTWETKKEDA